MTTVFKSMKQDLKLNCLKIACTECTFYPICLGLTSSEQEPAFRIWKDYSWSESKSDRHGQAMSVYDRDIVVYKDRL